MSTRAINQGSASESDDGWRSAAASIWPVHGGVLLLSVAALLLLYWTTALSMITTWQHNVTYNHGFGIIPISLYMIAKRRRQLANILPAADWRAVPVIGILVIGWFVAYVGQVAVVQQLTLVGMIPALVWLVLGSPIVQILVFPLAVLIFAVPFGEELIAPLQDFTAAFVVHGLNQSGVPVYQEGRVLIIPSGSWEVAESCSGIRYVFASLVCGCVIADMAYRSWVRRAMFILVAGFLPVFGNGVRAYGVVMLAHLSSNRIAAGIDHLVYGGVFFGLMVGLLAWVGLRWGDRRFSAPEVGGSRQGLAAAARPLSPLTVRWAAVVGLAICAIGPASAHAYEGRRIAAEPLLFPAPVVSQPWAMADEQQRGEQLLPFHGASAEVRRTFSDGAHVVHLYIAYYRNEKDEVELITRENIPFKRGGQGKWLWIGEEDTGLMVDGHSIDAREIHFRSSMAKRNIVTWYWIGDVATANRYYAKLLQISSRLLGPSPWSAAVVLDVEYDGDAAKGTEVVQDLARHLSFLPESSRRTGLQ